MMTSSSIIKYRLSERFNSGNYGFDSILTKARKCRVRISFEIYSKGQLITTNIVVELAIDWYKTGIIALHYLVLNKTLLEGVAILIRNWFLLEDFEQRLTHLLLFWFIVHFYAVDYKSC
jgi:hypothetical protein